MPKVLASTSIAAFVGILLVVGATYLRKWLLMQSRGAEGVVHDQ